MHDRAAATTTCYWCGRVATRDDLHHGRLCEDCWGKHLHPTAGDPATYTIGSDSYPYTVTRVSASGKTIWIRADKPRRGVFEPAAGRREMRCYWSERRQVWRISKQSCGHVHVGVRRLNLCREF